MVEEEYDTYDTRETYDDPFEDEQEDLAEDQSDLQNEIYDDTSPSAQRKDDLYSLFWRVIATPDSSKVGNLDKAELGMLDISVRDCQRIALLAESLGHPGFAKFFLKQGEIILSTSSSKKGWLPELFVSQRKLKTREHAFKNLPSSQPRKKKLFGR